MDAHKEGRIQSRPGAQKNLGSNTTGKRRTGLETERDGILYVPESFDPKSPSPMIIMFHGAGGDAHHSIDPLQDLSDRTGAILLAPESQGANWDLLEGRFGEDVYFLDEALSDVFALYPIDPKRIAVAGFSDGASYALAIAARNPNLFTHVIAFSPTPAARAELKNGGPAVYVSHGVDDDILPIDEGARPLVAKLRDAGVDVTFDEFQGGHTIPSEIGRSAFIWFLGTEAIDETRGAKVRSDEAGLQFT